MGSLTAGGMDRARDGDIGTPKTGTSIAELPRVLGSISKDYGLDIVSSP